MAKKKAAKKRTAKKKTLKASRKKLKRGMSSKKKMGTGSCGAC